MKIWWTFKGDDDDLPYNLTTNDGVVVTRNGQKLSFLNIEAVKARHRGNYTCYAQNKGGHSQHSAFLSINGSKFDHFFEKPNIKIQNFAI